MNRTTQNATKPSFYEFFAGAGMARAGMGDGWQCLFANDFDLKKGRTYEANWGAGTLKIEDVGKLAVSDLPGIPNLFWASFPCQDLSLAGGGAGLKGNRSGTFWPFWNLMKALIKDKRAPKVIALENVCGTLTSHEGKDFATICTAFQQAGYKIGAFVVDAVLFVPQSRPRLFFVATHPDVTLPVGLSGTTPIAPWHTKSLIAAHNGLPGKVKESWVWWHLPAPPARKKTFADMIEENDDDLPWFSAAETQNLLAMMSDINREKVAEAKRQGRRMVGAVYKRTRPDAKGRKVQRAEIRFDDVSGCLRTPAGGSSRQVVVIVDGKSVKARLISARETARLMGLPETYALPPNYNEAYHLTGDGVVVPVVRHLAAHLLEPLVRSVSPRETVAA
jgi:DNA (cytosine-5)-methyltransferase 1